MIARHWRGVARRERAEAYVEHVRVETFPAMARLPGFLSASILRRRVPDGEEFLVITNWESLAAIRAFAGEDVERAVVPDIVQEMMVTFERTARHYEVVT